MISEKANMLKEHFIAETKDHLEKVHAAIAAVQQTARYSPGSIDRRRCQLKLSALENEVLAHNANKSNLNKFENFLIWLCGK